MKKIFCEILRSLPLWKRGLKYAVDLISGLANAVASLVEAWVEISFIYYALIAGGVASLVEAWVEIGYSWNGAFTCVSLPLWKRGLK